MKTFLKSILIGIGFAVGIALVLFCLQFVKGVGRDESIVGKDYAQIINDKFSIQSGAITGTVTNTTDKTLQYVIVEGLLFDKSGAFLAKREEYANEIEPHGTFNFQVQFSKKFNPKDGSFFIKLGDDEIKSEDEVLFEAKLKQGFIK